MQKNWFCYAAKKKQTKKQCRYNQTNASFDFVLVYKKYIMPNMKVNMINGCTNISLSHSDNLIANAHFKIKCKIK